MSTVLDVAIWMLMAAFVVLWALFVVRAISHVRLRARLARREIAPHQKAELLARSQVRILVVFMAGFAVVLTMVGLMLAAGSLENAGEVGSTSNNRLIPTAR